MTIWTRKLDVRHLVECVNAVNAEFPGCGVYLNLEAQLVSGPRSRRIEHVHLRTTAGGRFPNSGIAGAQTDERAASWTEWGWFLARVFERDAEARCGGYRGVEDFHAQTGRRFRDSRTPRERQVARVVAVLAA